jgi:hypothetical protein
VLIPSTQAVEVVADHALTLGADSHLTKLAAVEKRQAALEMACATRPG